MTSDDDDDWHQFDELLQRARQGDESARNVVLQRLREVLRPIVEQALGPKLRVRTDGSDLLQKVLIQVTVDLPQFRGENVAEFMGWVRRIVERDILELLQREKFTSKRSIDREEDASFEIRQATGRQTSASQRMIRQEHSQHLLAALEQLDEEIREVMKSKYLVGESIAEIARQLSISESNVARLLAKGMSQVKAILKQRGITDA